MITERQRLERRKGIGSSDAAAILGLVPNRTAYDVYLEKTGRLQEEDGAPSDEAEIGNILEPAIGKLSQLRIGRPVVRSTSTFVAANDVLRSNIDFFVESSKRGSPIVEAKSGGSDVGWGQSGTSDVPERVLVQVTAQRICTGSDLAYVSHLRPVFSRWKFDMYTIDGTARDMRRLAEVVEEQCCQFWRQNVEKDIPPRGSPSLDVVAKVVRATGKSIVLADGSDDLVASYLTAKEFRRDAERACDEAEAILKASLQDAEIGQTPGGAVIRFGMVHTKRFDTEAFRAAHPDLYAQFVKPGGYRRFSVKTTKGDGDGNGHSDA